jgi:hypothetical protein
MICIHMVTFASSHPGELHTHDVCMCIRVHDIHTYGYVCITSRRATPMLYSYTHDVCMCVRVHDIHTYGSHPGELHTHDVCICIRVHDIHTYGYVCMISRRATQPNTKKADACVHVTEIKRFRWSRYLGEFA